MDELSFEWDAEKSILNKAKHGVDFKEAATVFYDDNALLEYDELHSDDEDRFRIIGSSNIGNVLLVVHCIREDRIIRIISSRKATAHEKESYERMAGI